MAQRTKIHYSASPRADLLPDAQRAERHHQETLPKLLLALVASAAVAGLIWAAGMVPVHFANTELHAAESTSQQLLEEIASYAEVGALVRDSGTLTAARAVLTAREVLFAPLLDEAVTQLVDGVSLVSFTGALAAADGSNAVIGGSGGEVDLNPLCVAATATITVKLAFEDLGQSAVVLDNLADVTGIDCLMATVIEEGSTETGSRVLTAQYAVNSEVLADRFVEESE